VYDEITGGSDFIQLGEYEEVSLSLQRLGVVHGLGLEERTSISLFLAFFHFNIFL
jgi:hypothetical protein